VVPTRPRFASTAARAQGTAILIDGAGTQRAQNGTFFSEVDWSGPFRNLPSHEQLLPRVRELSGGVVTHDKVRQQRVSWEAMICFRNTSLNANSFINNSNKLPRNIDRENDFGFQCRRLLDSQGVQREKSHVFLFNYEGYRFTQGENVLLTVQPPKCTRAILRVAQRSLCVNFFGGRLIYDPHVDPSNRTAVPGQPVGSLHESGHGSFCVDPAGQAILDHFRCDQRRSVHNYRASSIIPTR